MRGGKLGGFWKRLFVCFCVETRWYQTKMIFLRRGESSAERSDDWLGGGRGERWRVLSRRAHGRDEHQRQREGEEERQQRQRQRKRKRQRENRRAPNHPEDQRGAGRSSTRSSSSSRSSSRRGGDRRHDSWCCPFTPSH